MSEGSGSPRCPRVFVDVDGPLIPSKARPGSRERSPGRADAQPSGDTGNPVPDQLDPEDGRRLPALGCQLAWATTWMAEANEVISPRLGLPDLPVVEWPDDDEDPERGLHWKTCSFPGGRVPVHSSGSTTR
jgi:hypothetical protein